MFFCEQRKAKMQSKIFQDAVQEKLSEFLSGQFEDAHCNIAFLIIQALLTVECQYLVHQINVTQGAFCLIFVFGN